METLSYLFIYLFKVNQFALDWLVGKLLLQLTRNLFNKYNLWKYKYYLLPSIASLTLWFDVLSSLTDKIRNYFLAIFRNDIIRIPVLKSFAKFNYRGDVLTASSEFKNMKLK